MQEFAILAVEYINFVSLAFLFTNLPITNRQGSFQAVKYTITLA